MSSHGQNPFPQPASSRRRRRHRRSRRNPNGGRQASALQGEYTGPVANMRIAEDPFTEHHSPSPAVVEDPEADMTNLVGQMSHNGRKRSRSDEESEADDEPPQKKRRVKEGTNMWTAVKEYLENPESAAEPQVSCPVCMVEIAIRGVPGQSPCPYKLDQGEQVVGVVLACAHIICQDCIAKHLSAQAEISARHQTCPCCRADLKFSKCRHLIPRKRIPIATYEVASKVPSTMPECAAAGQTFPEWCMKCSLSCTQEYIDVTYDSYIAEIMPAISGTGSVANDPEWQRIVQASFEAVKKYFLGTRKESSWGVMTTSDMLLEVAFVNDERLGDLAERSAHGHGLIEHALHDGDVHAFWSVPQWRNDT